MAVPGTVSGKTASQGTYQDHIAVAWSTRSATPPVSSYNIYRSIDGAVSFSLLANVLAPTISYDDYTAPLITTAPIYYQVSSINSDGEGLHATAAQGWRLPPVNASNPFRSGVFGDKQ